MHPKGKPHLPSQVAQSVVFKKDFSSSGLLRVRVYNEHGMAERTGPGTFPRVLVKRFPRALDRLVAQAGSLLWDAPIGTEGAKRMGGLALLGTCRKQVNVL